MINTESKKYKGLGLYALLILMLCVHVPVLGVIGFTNSFTEEIYPLFSLLDAYFLFQLIFNPVLLSSLVKKVVEIEEKNNMFQLQENKARGSVIENVDRNGKDITPSGHSRKIQETKRATSAKYLPLES